MMATRIVIFAKAPVPELAKTRLIPRLGAEGAAVLARLMLDVTLERALAADIGPVELCVSPEIDDPAWNTFARLPGIEYSSQGDGDLGVRMGRAAERIIRGGESIVMIGTDCPELTPARLRHAAALLREADATLFSAVDGGYVLLGLNRHHPYLFEGIPWGTSIVAFATLCRLGQLGWTVRNGPMLHDIDEPEDLKWVPDEWLQRMPAGTHAIAPEQAART
ncbi:MAG: TIGR04282 family arsenosugar biosynthesis glycosyltransferase [Sphingomonadaceae bacterium]|nr:TIGR04282 family arsenosugar biosynthesis glycosyltransferase [Sphingomonadaceae bacterium]